MRPQVHVAVPPALSEPPAAVPSSASLGAAGSSPASSAGAGPPRSSAYSASGRLRSCASTASRSASLNCCSVPVTVNKPSADSVLPAAANTSLLASDAALTSAVHPPGDICSSTFHFSLTTIPLPIITLFMYVSVYLYMFN
ncbi:hypothetical protein [Paenibacillus tundrae]|uniref:hypothetical protein n=1 Tax=Paenibacillus tundrae TaxID=528187 RepID=UPI0022A90264|nr:hypothetical protein [Paenibacillus tundrae]